MQITKHLVSSLHRHVTTNSPKLIEAVHHATVSQSSLAGISWPAAQYHSLQTNREPQTHTVRETQQMAQGDGKPQKHKSCLTCSMALLSLFMLLSKRGKWEKKNSWNLAFSSSLGESRKMTPIAIFFFLATPKLGPLFSSDMLKLSSTDLECKCPTGLDRETWAGEKSLTLTFKHHYCLSFLNFSLKFACVKWRSWWKKNLL